MIKIQNLKTTIPTDPFGFAVEPIESWVDALITRPRAVIGEPKYGTLFPTRKHRSFGSGEHLDYKRDFRDACAFDPRLTFQRVDFNLAQMSVGVIGFTVYLGIGTISGELAA